MTRTRRIGNRLTTEIEGSTPPRPDPERRRRKAPSPRQRFRREMQFRRTSTGQFDLPEAEPTDAPGPSQRPTTRDTIPELPRPKVPKTKPFNHCSAQWNSVALFFNLDVPIGALPNGYAKTDAQAALDFLDEGGAPMKPGISEFLCRYWSALSYEEFGLGLATPRDSKGTPLVPTITPVDNNPDAWGDLIAKCLEKTAEAAWKAAGALIKDEKRWIPSVVLVQNYPVGASASNRHVEYTVDGEVYLVTDRTHIRYSLDISAPEGPDKAGRVWWGTLCHELAHNYVASIDLYKGQGCTGYWDLLGDNARPGRMSEICSMLKEQVGWLEFKQIIEGPTAGPVSLSLKPYSTTGEAFKIVPDPEHTPHEYFLLEFRKSTGDEVWRPDGGLPEDGLLIIHLNDRLSVASTWLLREAPFFDPEFADDPVIDYVNWTGHDDLAGKVFPQAGKTSFTPATTPRSHLYGGRNSGLSITDITVSGNSCTFDLQLDCHPEVGWTVGSEDRAVAGRFTADSPTGGEEIFLRNDDDAALLTHRQAQWLVNRVHRDWIDGWKLGPDDREVVGDLDGDGLDEIFIRSPDSAGVLEYRQGGFRSVSVQPGNIDGWEFGRNDWEHVANLDGDGRAEIYLRSPGAAGVVRLLDDRLRLVRLHPAPVGGWSWSPDDTELVGRFSTPSRDEVAIRNPDSLGLMQWNDDLARLELVDLEEQLVDAWNLGAQDWHAVGDFDGDGFDEIFLRTDQMAGVIKWQAGGFKTIWMANDSVPHVDGDPEKAWKLAPDDRLYSGRFRQDRDGILIRNDLWGVAVITWANGAMRIVQPLKSKFDGRWRLKPECRFVLGDFHRLGKDIANPSSDVVVDGLTDVFIHRGWGTAMIGVNHGYWNPNKPKSVLDTMGLTWIQEIKLIHQD